MTFETYSAVDLPKHGLKNYVDDPYFTPLLAAVMKDDEHGALLDFTVGYEESRLELIDLIGNSTIVAHNAGFEQAVLERMGIVLDSSRFIDSAVLARAYGAGGSLEAAAPQILGSDKLESGKHLIQLFSIPGKYQEDSPEFDPRIKDDHLYEWLEFSRYCMVDASLSLRLARELLPKVAAKELKYAAITMDMNRLGWHVDMDAVQTMQHRYQQNVDSIIADFRTACNAPDLNLASSQQLAEWCRKRGVKAVSFDEQHVASLLGQLQEKLKDSTLPLAKQAQYGEVVVMLQAKQAMGGSSLKKLATISSTIGRDGKLHDQYLHIGASATYRTTGRGVQMQNLKRLNGEGDDMLELYVPDIHWDNDRLASNLRQVFTATHPHGRLIVGDLSSVESRGLAWLAGEQWKLDAYEQGQDLYKVQAGLIFGKPEREVSKQERQTGKVGELSCGYGAGPEAVKEFATSMGVDMSELEAAKLVKDWRSANPGIVRFWHDLDAALHTALLSDWQAAVAIPHGFVTIAPVPAPQSLCDQVGDQGLRSLQVAITLKGVSDPFLVRTIHGAHEAGRNILYWKPSERKTGDLWKDRFTDPKTKQTKRYSVYGGKLAGLLTQSLCREVFFTMLERVQQWTLQQKNVTLIGQFHDEMVLDWSPGSTDLGVAMLALKLYMTEPVLPGFPLNAEVKSDYRYTK